MSKIKIPDVNKNGKLDWFDVIVYWGTLGLNAVITASTIYSNIAG